MNVKPGNILADINVAMQMGATAVSAEQATNCRPMEEHAKARFLFKLDYVFQFIDSFRLYVDFHVKSYKDLRLQFYLMAKRIKVSNTHAEELVTENSTHQKGLY